MQKSRMRSTDRTGFTLTEVLVVVVLVSAAAAIIGFSFQKVLEGNRALEERRELMHEAQNALATFTADVRSAKAVLGATPEKISFWASDSDSDGAPNLTELINYTYVPVRGARSPWKRETWNSHSDLASLSDLQVAADTIPPGIRHVVIHIQVGSRDEIRWLGTSVWKREQYLGPQN